MQRIGTKEGQHEWRVTSQDVDRMGGGVILFDRFTSPPNWMADASCVGRHEDFEVPDVLDGDLIELWSKLRNATENYCFECPVRERCGSEATANDREWSIRGGEVPRAVKRMVR